jgi:hypothetical protein
MNITRYPYDLMTVYGSMYINDLGNYEECRKLDMGDYVVITGNITRIPLTVFFSGCLPK